MDDELDEIIERPEAQRHDKWSFIVLAVDLAHNIVAEIEDTLSTATTLLLQHREHKMEESKFFEVVSTYDDPS